MRQVGAALLAAAAVAGVAYVAVREGDPPEVTVILRAWIPQAKLASPQAGDVGGDCLRAFELPRRSSGLIDPAAVAPLAHLPPDHDVSRTQRLAGTVVTSYRGDNHLGFEGPFRGEVTLSFRWDGSSITSATDVVRFGTTYRDRVFQPDDSSQQPIKCSDTATATKRGEGLQTDAPDRFRLSLSARNPLVSPSPAIDAELDGSFESPSRLRLNLATDKFPSYGAEVRVNGRTVAMIVTFDASCADSTAAVGRGLLSHSHKESYLIDLAPGDPSTQRVINACRDEDPGSLPGVEIGARTGTTMTSHTVAPLPPEFSGRELVTTATLTEAHDGVEIEVVDVRGDAGVVWSGADDFIKCFEPRPDDRLVVGESYAGIQLVPIDQLPSPIDAVELSRLPHAQLRTSPTLVASERIGEGCAQATRNVWRGVFEVPVDLPGGTYAVVPVAPYMDWLWHCPAGIADACSGADRPITTGSLPTIVLSP